MRGIVARMTAIDGVHLRGGPCDGERPDHSAGVGHFYETTEEYILEAGLRRRILVYRRTVTRAAVGAR